MKMKATHSIRVKLALTLAILIGGTVFLCWIMNKSFLGEYYKHIKVKALEDVYKEVDILKNTVESEEELSTILDELDLGDSNRFNPNRIEENASEEKKVSDTDVKSRAKAIADAMDNLGDSQSINLYLFNLYYTQVGLYSDFVYPELDVIRETEVFDRIKGYLMEENIRRREQRELLHEEDAYWIYKVYDVRTSNYYLELFGMLEDETTIYIRSSYQSIMESVEIANQFLAYIGIVAVVIGLISMLLISSSFTNPILELADIASKMCELDFDVRYKETKRKDEVGILGNSMNKLSETLESTISELKTANNELELDIANKIQIDEMRTEFLSNVSHELKTPIALIQGYAEGLKENINDDEESRDFYCEVIMDEANKMNKMVKKLMSLNQIEFGKDVSMERFDIVSLVKSVIDSTSILFQQKNVTLYFNPGNPIFVWADEYMIEEVVTNYISNALNHVSGANIIEVKLIQSNGIVRIAVFNTGETIPEEELEKVWVKFYKVDKARTREYGGSGIGLSIVKAIMKSHNQACGVVNHETGVEFWFELDTKN